MQVLEDRRGEFRFASGHVDVFDAQQEPAAQRFGPMRREQRRIGVAQMQQAIGARGEAEDGFQHGEAAST